MATIRQLDPSTRAAARAAARVAARAAARAARVARAAGPRATIDHHVTRRDVRSVRLTCRRRVVAVAPMQAYRTPIVHGRGRRADARGRERPPAGQHRTQPGRDKRVSGVAEGLGVHVQA